MSLKLLPIDLDRVRAMVGLADGAWTEEGLRRALVELGWAREGEELVWAPGDARSPVLEFEDGWTLELGAPPSEPDSYAVLPFALLWPPLGADEHDDELDDEDDEEEDDLDEDYPEAWERLPEAGPAEFEAEFLRVRALVEGLIGPPGRIYGNFAQGARWDVWERGTTVLTLFAQDDIPSYSHYDRLALGVWRAEGWRPPQ